MKFSGSIMQGRGTTENTNSVQKKEQFVLTGYGMFMPLKNLKT